MCIPAKNRRVQASFAGGFFPFLPAVNYHSQMSSGEATDDRATDGDVCGRILRMFLCAKDPWQYIYVCDNHFLSIVGFSVPPVFLTHPSVSYILRNMIMNMMYLWSIEFTSFPNICVVFVWSYVISKTFLGEILSIFPENQPGFGWTVAARVPEASGRQGRSRQQDWGNF